MGFHRSLNRRGALAAGAGDRSATAGLKPSFDLRAFTSEPLDQAGDLATERLGMSVELLPERGRDRLDLVDRGSDRLFDQRCRLRADRWLWAVGALHGRGPGDVELSLDALARLFEGGPESANEVVPLITQPIDLEVQFAQALQSRAVDRTSAPGAHEVEGAGRPRHRDDDLQGCLQCAKNRPYRPNPGAPWQKSRGPAYKGPVQNPFEAPEKAAETTRPAPGATGLFYQRIAELVLSLISSAYYAFFTVLGADWERSTMFFRYAWLALGIWAFVAMLPMNRGAKGTDAESITLAALVLCGISATIMLPELFGLYDLGLGSFNLDRRIVTALYQALAIATDLTFWFALVRLAATLPSWATPAFISTRLGMLALRAPYFLFATEDLSVFHQGPLATVLQLIRLPVSVGCQAVVIWSLHQWRVSKRKAPSETPFEAPITAGSAAQKDLIFGAVWLFGGLIVTAVSYSAASQGGGSYVVTTGAIAYGLVRLIRGALRAAG